jgi:uncharacterized membrane-anchored protein
MVPSLRLLYAVAFVLVGLAAAVAEPQQAALPRDEKATEIQDSIKAGLAVSTKGPAKVALIDEATIQILANEAFIPRAEGLRILRALGSFPYGNDMLGLIVGLTKDNNWIVVVRYIKDGYVKDDDARNWDAGDLRNSIWTGFEKSKEYHFQPIEVLSWIEQPTYDFSQHLLVWSLLIKMKGEAGSDGRGVNYNTVALGRDGYFRLEMATNASRVEQYKPVANALLANLVYNQGKSYEDFNASTDQVASYGLATLVTGVVAKKDQPFADSDALLVKIASFARIVILAAAGVGIYGFFKPRRKA